MKKRFLILLMTCLISTTGMSQMSYQLPPQDIIDLVDAPSVPTMSISPANNAIAFIENRGLPALEDIAREELRLGGVRIDPITSGPSRASYGISVKLTDINGHNERIVTGLPASAKIRNVRWSPDSRHIAFTHTYEKGIELWVINVQEARAWKISNQDVNNVLGGALTWSSDNATVFYSAVVADRPAVPERPRVAQGPVVQESSGRRAAVRTYQDLLKDQHDEVLFDYFMTSQIVKVDLQGNASPVGQPGIIWYYSLSPNGQYLLLNRIEKPYSYIVPFSRFPQTMEVLDLQGNRVYLVAEVPVSDNLPQGFDAVRTGRRSVQWRNDTPATLYWVEALDGGDPAVEVEFREQLYFLDAPFTGEPVQALKLALRYAGISWGKNDFAIVYEMWRRNRRSITSSFNPSRANATKAVIWDQSMEDRYNDPGSFQMAMNAQGQFVLQTDRRGRKLYLFGQGASPEGNRPFVDEYDIATRRTTRLWRSQAPYYEIPVSLVDLNNSLLMTRRESVDEHPDFYMRDLRRNRITKVTNLPDPAAPLRSLHSEIVHYQREDGIPLNGRLYLPAGYNKEKDGPLPTLLWAYPQEFKSADAAGQVTTSPYTYTRVGATSPVILATQGYAVLNNASFPIVGEADEEPNDTFVEQLVANAKAAIDKLVEMGVTDPARVAVSGHSYGAFMTANLLAHSDLFAAGIARSGAYNRTLTPFGFQGEERTFWDVPEVYMHMSPFTHAHKIKTPLLLIHGADDNNAGTFPVQSERMYDGMRGQGGTVRLVMLPHEGHGYSARESALHMHWEWLEWLNRYVKNKPAK
jgi:dipeptidyl aminopeptidase/acylaminoacyl peptidase